MDHRPDLGLTFGAIEVGMVLAVFLTGISTLQVWNYYRDYPDDSTTLKSLVGVVYTADTVHSIMLAHALYHYTIVVFGDYEALEVLAKSSSGGILVAGLIAFAVQTFYALRVQRITKSRLIAGVCWLLALLRLVFCFCISVTVIASGRFEAFVTDSVRWQLVAMQCVGAASDVLIAACICAGILRLRSGLTASDKLVDKLVAFTIGSGLLTSVVAIAEIVTYVTMENFVFITFYSIAAKLFANSLLASLNERNAMRRALPTWNSMQTRGQTNSQHITFHKPKPGINVELTHVPEDAEVPTSKTRDLPRDAVTV
ncbi:hypothetical protein EXIGLDRAFT_837791 [Exidia glandulosa HHB12029]|uniref:DUF6534 domain-containing protein n=1 Tax=Exidia glandulosa HHB12029 TaxID=1314781 RepID=A0A165GG05_EXIGL|nr:hypothetical protein EXIGLDRAFT_837791 [Exidia glandulosa HHB12029]